MKFFVLPSHDLARKFISVHCTKLKWEPLYKFLSSHVILTCPFVFNIFGSFTISLSSPLCVVEILHCCTLFHQNSQEACLTREIQVVVSSSNVIYYIFLNLVIFYPFLKIIFKTHWNVSRLFLNMVSMALVLRRRLQRRLCILSSAHL